MKDIFVFHGFFLIFAFTKKGEAMEATVFNPVQQHLLRMFAHDGSEERLSEVKEVLSRHFFRKLDESLDEAWKSGRLSQERLDELRKVDIRKHLRNEE